MNGAERVAHLGGGYESSEADPSATVRAVLDAASQGAAGTRLVVIAGPPGVGKSALAASLATQLPGSFIVDKDWAAGGFILDAAAQQGLGGDQAYGHRRYWTDLRPLEYAGAMVTACANLVGRRTVLLTGGWGPELGVDGLWQGLRERLQPARLLVLHLDAPSIPAWRARMAARGSRSDQPWFDTFAAAVTAHPVWREAARIATEGPPHEVLQRALDILSE